MATHYTKQRMYIPLWEAIKKHSIVQINAPAAKHARICKAVIKEKWMDQEFKQQEGWRMKYLTYSCNAETNTITFFLNYKLTDLLSKDL